VAFSPLSHFVIYSDLPPESLSAIFTNEVVETLKTYEPYWKYIYYSDQSSITPKYKKIIRFQYKLPISKGMDTLTPLMKIPFFYIDLIGSFNLSKNALTSIERRRMKIEEQLQRQLFQERQEKIQQKKIEQKKKEEEKVEKMSPEAQKKWEEKEYKKQLKEKQSRFKVKYG